MYSRRAFLAGGIATSLLALTACTGREKHDALDALRQRLGDGHSNISIRLIGDSITWGANADGYREYVSPQTNPKMRLLTDTRAPLSIPSYANLLRQWVVGTYFRKGSAVPIRGGVQIRDGRRKLLFVNDGINGATSDRWLPGGPLLGGQEGFDFVICMLGTNDRARSAPAPLSPKRTEKNLREIVRFVEGSGGRVILATPNKVSSQRDFSGRPDLYAFSQEQVAGTVRNVAETLPTVGFVDCYSATASVAESLLLSDGLHPSDFGHRLMFEEFLRVLKG
ncbi:SGNH/GDSL hydrolase family protein [Hoeflea sp.]|uniref:SGNH/GDSL hydrolase family protein n=1 Tax=Hoeflea sp. TaxID=1940281 RepID=UPI003A9420F3